LTVDDGIDDFLELITPIQYAKIEDKTQTGVPIKAVWRGPLSPSEFWFWPVPAVAGVVKLTYEKFMDDTSASAAPDVDVAMMRSLKNLVRYDVADYWGKPEPTILRWERVAKEAEKIIRKVNAPRVDYKTIAVDDFDDSTRRETDY
jgi:hypothetical protein